MKCMMCDQEGKINYYATYVWDQYDQDSEHYEFCSFEHLMEFYLSQEYKGHKWTFTMNVGNKSLVGYDKQEMEGLERIYRDFKYDLKELAVIISV